MTGEHVSKGWDEQRRKERGKRKLMPSWTLGKKKGGKWTTSSGRKEPNSTRATVLFLSIFNFQFQPRFLLLVCFLFTINTAMNTMNQCTFHISRFLSFSRRIHVEWILSKHRVEVKNVLRGKGNNMVRLIINKEILTQQYIKLQQKKYIAV
jgi:hypothetical protein